MSLINRIISNITASYTNDTIPTSMILSVLLVVLLLSVYEFAVYRLVSRRAFYNRSFNISVAVIPFFIATIILCLQSNLVLTLGTIGALAIIRFRTAVKDPVDMLYILWAIHNGIVCGCRLFEVAVLTSLVVTIVLLVLEHVNFGRRPQILVVHTKENSEALLTDAVKETAKSFRIKSRSTNGSGMDFVYELTIKDAAALTDKLNALPEVERFSLIEYDAQDII